ncbi:MAG: hypothetical protein NVS1B1_05260 [Candidatus Limnocylindrales bacterium]
MAAPVPDLGKSVVLGEQPDRLSRRTDTRTERSFNPAAIALDRMAMGLEDGGDPRDGTMLLIGELGLAVDATRKSDKLIP